MPARRSLDDDTRARLPSLAQNAGARRGVRVVNP